MKEISAIVSLMLLLSHDTKAQRIKRCRLGARQNADELSEMGEMVTLKTLESLGMLGTFGAIVETRCIASL